MVSCRSASHCAKKKGDSRNPVGNPTSDAAKGKSFSVVWFFVIAVLLGASEELGYAFSEPCTFAFLLYSWKSIGRKVKMSFRRGRDLQSEDGYAMPVFPKCYVHDSSL